MENQCKQCGRNGHQQNQCAAKPQQFVWQFGGSNVKVVGEWSKWQILHQMKQDQNNSKLFITTLALWPGLYQYKYIVDGVWKYNHQEPIEKDNNGEFNNVIKVFPAIFEIRSENESSSEIEIQENHFFDMTLNNQNARKVKIQTALLGEKVQVKGSWDKWALTYPMKKKHLQGIGKDVFIGYFNLMPGIYQYKFLIDDKWTLDMEKMKIHDDMGQINNVINVQDFQSDNRKHKQLFNINNLEWHQIEEQGLSQTSIQGHSMTFIADKIYIYGGFYHGRFMDTMYEVDLGEHEVNLIECEGPAPKKRAYHCAVEFGTKIIIFGGLNNQTVFNDYQVFNTVDKTWTQSKVYGSVPMARERMTLTKISDENLLLFGGYECSQNMDLEKNFDDLHFLNLITMNWKSLTVKGSIPARSCHTAVVFKHVYYVFGGVQRDLSAPKKIFNDLHKINFDEKNDYEWIDLTSQIKGQIPSQRYGHTALVVNFFMVIYGGRCQNESASDEIFMLDLNNLIWIQPNIKGQSPGEKWSHSAVVDDYNDIYIFGGHNVKQKGTFGGKKNIIYQLTSNFRNMQYQQNWIAD